MRSPAKAVSIALTVLLVGSLAFVGQSAAVSGTLFSCSNSSAPAFSFGSISPGLKKAETDQRLRGKFQVTDCVADATQLENGLPSKRGLPASKSTAIATGYVALTVSGWSDCLVDGVTTGGDSDTDNEYALVGKLGIKWTDVNGSSVSAGTTTVIVRGNIQATFPPTVALHGIVSRGPGIGSDFDGVVELTALPGDTALSDCFVDGSPGAIVSAVQVTPTGTWTINLP